ncbi:MAG: patatin-like phospholipase family protein [Verrucomicrobia bacterium]|nr:patatin-like phospholipase family protein [Cytophagales bacterium]
MEIRRWTHAVLFSFPLQLLLLHAKKNTWVLILWGILFGVVGQGIGNIFGIPYLFLDPEYKHEVSLGSMFIMGIATGGFIISFHITCYILDAHRFSFLGNVRQPFAKFCANNNTIPLLFVVFYLLCFIRFQLSNTLIDKELSVVKILTWQVIAFLLGLQIAILPLFFYFVSTNQDVFKIVAKTVNRRLINPKIRRVNVMKDFATARYNRIRVDNYFDMRLKIHQADSVLQDLGMALRVLKQNHINGFIIQSFVFLQIIFLGIFRDKDWLQIPAAASVLLLATMVVMFTGAVGLWLNRWAVPVLVVVFLLFNFFAQKEWFEVDYKAFGLDYKNKATYSLDRIRQLTSDSLFRHDKDSTIKILERWKKRTGKAKPQLILVCASGGGQRAAVWTMRSLQFADSVLQGKLFKHTVLITGASGGLVGASYFRELYWQKTMDTSLNVYDQKYFRNLAKDNLNSIALTLVVSDLLFKTQRFEYNGFKYYKDRGYAFEQSLNRNTGGFLDKPLQAYHEPERQALIPMLLLSPTVINDGRKLFISSQGVSYMTVPDTNTKRYLTKMVKGIEFQRFFGEQQAGNLRFLSALRMSATFPYVTPNVSLPSEPEMEIMDAGLSDNFGINDALRFLYVFRDWIAKNTGGVIILSIRDTPRNFMIEEKPKQSIIQQIFTPIGSLYTNWQILQDYNNDADIEFTQSWLKTRLNRIDIQYAPQLLNFAEDTLSQQAIDSLQVKHLQKRASLSWRLTEREKQSLRETIYETGNRRAIDNLGFLLK